jgi:hypothetical protein
VWAHDAGFKRPSPAQAEVESFDAAFQMIIAAEVAGKQVT